MKAVRRVTIVNNLGIHLRAAGVLAQAASQFTSQIWLDRDGTRANAKSIMSVLSLAASQGVELEVGAEGHDAQTAVDTLCGIIEGGFSH